MGAGSGDLCPSTVGLSTKSAIFFAFECFSCMRTRKMVIIGCV